MAELTNFYVEQNTVQSSSTASFVDISGLQINGSSLENNNKYLIVARALVGGNDTSAVAGIRVITPDDGDVANFSSGVYEMQQTGSTSLKTYMWVGSYSTDASAGDIKMQMSIGSASDTVYIDQASLLLLDLDAIGTEGTDYHESVRKTVQGEYANSPSRTSLRALAAADLGTDEWLIFGANQTDIAATGRWHEISVDAAPNQASTATVLSTKEDSEDAAEFRMFGFGIIHQDTSTASDVTIYGMQESAPANMYSEYTYLIALPTSLFADVEWDYDAGGITANGETTVQTVPASGTYTPSVTGNHLVIGEIKGNTSSTAAQLWVEEGTTEIRTGDSAPSHNQNWTSSDREWAQTFQRYSITGSSLTYNLQADLNAAANAENRWLVLVNLNEASTGDATATATAFVSTVTPNDSGRSAGATRVTTAFQVVTTIDAPTFYADAVGVATAYQVLTTYDQVTLSAGAARAPPAYQVLTTVDSPTPSGDANRATTAYPVTTTIDSPTFYADAAGVGAAFQVTTTVDSPAFYADAQVTTTAFQVVTTVDSPVVAGDANRATTAVIVTTTVDSPAFYADAQVTSDEVLVTTTIDTPVIDTGAADADAPTTTHPVSTTIDSLAFYADAVGVGTAFQVVTTIDSPTIDTTQDAEATGPAFQVVTTVDSPTIDVTQDAQVTTTAHQVVTTVDTATIDTTQDAQATATTHPVSTTTDAATITTGWTALAEADVIVTSTFPNVNITTGGDAQVSPSAFQVVTTIDSPALSVGADRATTAYQVTTTVDSPTFYADAAGVGTAFQVTATVDSPTVTGDANVTATAYPATTTIDAPTVTGDANVTATTFAVTTTIDSPAFYADAVGVATAYAATTTIDAPAFYADATGTGTAFQIVTTIDTVTVDTGQVDATATPAAFVIHAVWWPDFGEGFQGTQAVVPKILTAHAVTTAIDTPVILEVVYALPSTLSIQTTIPVQALELVEAVDASSDDGHIDGASLFLTAASLYVGLGSTQHMFFRFANVGVSKSVDIESAKIRLYFETHPTDDPPDAIAQGTIYGQDEADAIAFDGYASGSQPWTGRSPTTASTTWNFATDTTDGTWVESPDISSIIEEIAALPGWVNNNAMMFYWQDFLTLAGDEWQFEAWDSAGVNQAQLVITLKNVIPDATVTPTAVAVTTTIDPAVASGAVDVTATAFQVVTTVDTATVTTGDDAAVTPAPHIVTTTVDAPYPRTFSPVVVTTTFPQAVVGFDADVFPTAFQVVATVDTVDAAGGGIAVYATAFNVVHAVPFPIAGGDALVTTTAVAVTTTIGSAVIVVLVTPAAFAVTTTIDSPVVTSSAVTLPSVVIVVGTVDTPDLIGVYRTLRAGKEAGRFYRLDKGGGEYRFRLVWGARRGRSVGYQDVQWEKVSPKVRYDADTEDFLQQTAWDVYIADPGKAALTLYDDIKVAVEAAGFETVP